MVTQQDQESTRTDATMKIQPTGKDRPPQLRGELNYQGFTVESRDRRYGVRVPVGAYVTGDQTEGWVVGQTAQLCIFKDDKGQEHVERWGNVSVQASGPAEPGRVLLTGYPEPPAPRQAEAPAPASAEHAPREVNADPYYALSIHIENLRESIDRLGRDLNNAHDLDLEREHEAIYDALGTALDKLAEASSTARLPWLEGRLDAAQLPIRQVIYNLSQPANS